MDMHEQLELEDLEQRTVVSQADRSRKEELGQFMTPLSVARFMASMFPTSHLPVCGLLDAGAGVGALSCASSIPGTCNYV